MLSSQQKQALPFWDYRLSNEFSHQNISLLTGPGAPKSIFPNVRHWKILAKDHQSSNTLAFVIERKLLVYNDFCCSSGQE